MESRAVDVDGIRMRWEEEGEGPPVIFIHGIPTSPRLWRHVIPDGRNARSMAWEMVGYGYRLAYELGAPIERIEGGKHFVPEEVAAAVDGLLEQAAPGR